MLGACSKQHSNNFGTKLPQCHQGDWNVLNSSSQTCEAVFADALPRDIIRNPQVGVTYDEGSICNDRFQAVLFVQTDCASLEASNIQLRQRGSHGGFCWSGHTLSVVALTCIVLGSFLGVVLLTVLLLVFCRCRWQRKKRESLASAQRHHLPPSRVVKVADSVYRSAPDEEANKVILGDHVFLQHPYHYEYEYNTDGEGESDPAKGIPISDLSEQLWQQDSPVKYMLHGASFSLDSNRLTHY